jgi:hypothetical protein
MIFEILSRRINKKLMLYQQFRVSKIEVVLPEQQRSLMKTTPVQKVVVLSPVKN